MGRETITDPEAVERSRRTPLRPRITSLDELTRLLSEWPERDRLYLRWSRMVDADLDAETSRDDLTGIQLPGLSANALTVAPWWGDRSLRLWVARKLYDYQHLAELRGPGTEPWVMEGSETGRGPDNEPLITRCRLVAAVDAAVVREAADVVESMPSEWGSLRRQ